jgi:two-component system, OmpR family, response regulator
VDSVVSRLRRKIERDPNDPAMILTAWGVGYKFADA